VAETDDDNSTGEYRLLWTEFKFVKGLTGGSEQIADQVLRDFLQDGAWYPKFFADGPLDQNSKADIPIPGVDYSHDRYRIWKVEGWDSSRSPNPFKREFWESEPERDIYSLIDYPNSSGRWTGPVRYNARMLSKNDIAFLFELDGRPTRADYRAVLIRIHHETLLDTLRCWGLLPPLTESAPAPVVSELVPKPVETAPEPVSVLATEPQAPEASTSPALEVVAPEPKQEPTPPTLESAPKTPAPPGSKPVSVPARSPKPFPEKQLVVPPWPPMKATDYNTAKEWVPEIIKVCPQKPEHRRKTDYGRYLKQFAEGRWKQRTIENELTGLFKKPTQ
jgi:hypothetical protein